MAHDVGPIGGMERQLTELIDGLLSSGQHVTVISRCCDLPANPALRWVHVPGPARPFPVAYAWFFVVGTWLVWRHRVGLLQTTGAIVWNRADVCTVHFCHRAAQSKADMGRAAPSILRRINRRLSAALARFAETSIYRLSMVRHVVAVSEGIAQEMRECFPEVARKITVIPNAVDQGIFRPDRAAAGQVRRAHGLSDVDFVVLFIGGDWEWKGLAVAIQAVSGLTGCHLFVVGAGAIDRFRNMAGKLGCTDRIHFTGSRNDPARYYAASDVFLLPSAYESFSLVAYEAASAGLPLLVTRVSGVDQILTDGENGWFIQRDPDMIRSRLQALWVDEKLRKRMGARSREAVTRYCWPHVVDDYVALYRQLAETSTRATQDVDPVAAASR